MATLDGAAVFLPPLIAVAAAASSLYFSLRGARLQKESLRVQRDNDILSWGNQTIDNLSRLESIAYMDVAHITLVHEFNAKKIEYMAVLSSAIDKGRMYFPNVQREEHGVHKDSAFRGHRRPILDALVGAYSAAEQFKFGDAGAMLKVKDEINLSRRRFVAELQKSVDPDRRLRFLAEHVGADQDEVRVRSSNA
jgi:hypothetical protein